jgi:tripartite-type tricarboxylate transporter receptor subunit TctC
MSDDVMTKLCQKHPSRIARLVAALSLMGFVACISVPASSQSYPSRPIKVIVTGSAGGTPDVFMRAIGEELRNRLGQPLVIENRPGADFRIGARTCAESAPDGYTICILSNDALVYDQWLFKDLPYNPEKDFALITNAFFSTQVLVANAALKVKSLPELAALSRAKPRTLSYTAPGVPFWAFMENWKKQTGADLVRIPFRGGGEVVTSVLSGSTSVAFSGVSYWIPYVQNGTVTGLAIDSPNRLGAISTVPTLLDLGYGLNFNRVYFAIVAPAGTPAAIIERLNEELRRAMDDPGFRDKYLSSRGLEAADSTPDEFARFLAKDRMVSKRLVHDAGLGTQ